MIPGIVASSNRDNDPSFYALTFNGSTQYIEFGDNLNFDYNVARSFCAWVKPSINSSFQNIICRRAEPGGAAGIQGWSLQVRGTSDGQWGTTEANNSSGNGISYYSNAGSIVLSTWQLVVATYIGTGANGSILLYKNGTNITANYFSGPISATIINTATLRMGTGYSLSSPGAMFNTFQGQIGPAGVYNKVLSAAEITEIYSQKETVNWKTLSTGGNLLWHPNMIKGANPTVAGGVADRSGNGINGTGIGTPTVVSVFRSDLP